MVHGANWEKGLSAVVLRGILRVKCREERLGRGAHHLYGLSELRKTAVKGRKKGCNPGACVLCPLPPFT